MEKNKLCKTYRLIPFLLFFILMLTSCRVVKYSHNDIMNNYKTKSDVISRFGLPTEKRKEGDLEEWYYSYGSLTVSEYEKTNYFNTPVVSSESNTTQKFLKFTLKNNIVTNWTSQGVNLEETELNKKLTFATLIIFFGSIILIASGD